MSKRCRHTILEVTKNADCQTVALRCKACGVQLSLGASNDEPGAVLIEMRAAELEDTEHWGPIDVSNRERWGIEDHQRDDSSDDHGYALTGEYIAGFLSAEIESHGSSATRDASAWSWDISRPIAEQLAETARVDAASALDLRHVEAYESVCACTGDALESETCEVAP